MFPSLGHGLTVSKEEMLGRLGLQISKARQELQRFRKMGTQIPISDVDWDSPLTDEDLRVIDAVAAASPPPPRKRPALVDRDEDAESVGCPDRTRRRLPDSFVFQQQLNTEHSLSPCFRNCIEGRSYSPRASPFRDISFGGRIVYSRTVEEVEIAAHELLEFAEAKRRKDGQCIIGLDIEWKPTFKRGVAPGKAAVMQICGDNNCCYIFHIIHSQISRSLQCLLESPACQKVGLGIASDASKVLKDHNVAINDLEDLNVLANQKLGGEPKKWSLSSLTEMLICRKLPKPNRIRLGNWEAKVLSRDQLIYAATDAYISWYLFEVLRTFPDPVDNQSEERPPVPESHEVAD